MPGVRAHLPAPPPRLQAVTSRDLVDWCAARLAHYKVPFALHLLPRMPTTGSGKILKTELRRMFGSGAGAGAAASASGTDAGVIAGGPAITAGVTAGPAASLAEAAAVLAAACGGGIACQALDDGLGEGWGRELLPELTYLLAVDRADRLASQASAGKAGDGPCLPCLLGRPCLHACPGGKHALALALSLGWF